MRLRIIAYGVAVLVVMLVVSIATFKTLEWQRPGGRVGSFDDPGQLFETRWLCERRAASAKETWGSAPTLPERTR